VSLFASGHGVPEKTYVVGASEGGLITTLLVEGHPEVFVGGLAACGPVGDFEFQIRYFGDVRVLFEHFFPGLIPGEPFDPPPTLAAGWSAFYESTVRPAVLAAASRRRLETLAAVAGLPVDPANFLETAEACVRDALRYCVVNLRDARATLGGFPYDNTGARYSGSDDDDALNLAVLRVAADPAALAEMDARYDTPGVLERPLVAIHTTLDQQVPFAHEAMYDAKCAAAGSMDLRADIPVVRFGHCNFTATEISFAFGVLLYACGDGDLAEEIRDLLGG
jgi:pimeloyl-ACP methyl ester carboxylesterase